VADSKQRAEVIEHMKEQLIHLVHSREGAYATLQCIWHGTSKDRKAIVKSFKTMMIKTAQEEYGHMVLLGIFDCVDDTKFVGKAVIGELVENLDELFNNKFGVRVLKYMFSGRDTTYVNKDMIAILDKGDGNEHSKKDKDVRHKELVSVCAPPVLNYIKKNVPAMLYDLPTTVTLTCIMNNCPPCPELDEVFTSLAKLVTKPFSKGDDAPNLVENSGSNMMFKKIILKDKERAERGEPTISSYLLANLDEEGIDSWVRCNRGCFLFVNMLDTGLTDIQQQIKTQLKSVNKILKSQDSHGAKILLEKLAS